MYGSSLYRNSINFLQMASHSSPKLQGSRSRVSPAECTRMNGENTPNCIQRVYNSPSGLPVNPPISVPQNESPETARRCSCKDPMRKCSQVATLSPVHTDA